jgi:hypothetical protein
MKKVYKWYIEPKDEPTRIMLPVGSKVVWVNKGQIWIEGSFGQIEEREALFYTKGTGHPIIDDNLRHVGSYRAGVFVWHIYVYAGDWLEV